MTPALVVPVLGRKLYPGASVALDFTRNLYRSGTPVVKGSPSLLSGWTFTRDSTGYAETESGLLVPFASGVPRITDKGLLVEEARTNLARGSVLTGGTLFPTDWSATINNGSSRGPVASTTGAPGAWEASAVNQRECFQQIITLAANSTYTVSVYVEEVTGTTRILSYCSGLPAGATSGAIINPSTPGLYTYQVVTSATAGTCILRLGIDTGGELSANCTVRFSRVNFELGAFATSYIPTTSASATRAADSAILTGLTTLLANPFTVYARTLFLATAANNQGIFAVSDGTTANRVCHYRELSGEVINFNSRVAAAGVYSAISAAKAGARTVKTATAYTGTDYVSSADGVAVTGATAAIGAMSRLECGRATGDATASLNAYLQSLVIYPVAHPQATQNAATS